MEKFNNPIYQAPGWIKNPHFQTFWAPCFRSPFSLNSQIKTIETPDGDFLQLHSLEANNNSPWVLLIHGLEGSIRSHYINGMIWTLNRIGWNSVLLEFRSCSGRMNQAKRLYHSGETGDIDFIAQYINKQINNSPLYLISFSLGGNAALKWLGEKGTEVQIKGAVSVCPPYDLGVSAKKLDQSLGGFYSRRFLKTLISKALEKEKQFPGIINNKDELSSCRSIIDYDDWVTAPIHGFEDAWDY